RNVVLVVVTYFQILMDPQIFPQLGPAETGYNVHPPGNAALPDSTATAHRTRTTRNAASTGDAVAAANTCTAGAAKIVTQANAGRLEVAPRQHPHRSIKDGRIHLLGRLTGADGIDDAVVVVIGKDVEERPR